METTPVVYLLVPLGLSYGREVMRGVRDHIRANRAWQLAVAEPTGAILRSLARKKPDGIIGWFTTESLERTVRALNVPSVNVCSRARSRLLPRVAPDDAAMGRMAAEHLLERGFRNLAFAALPGQYCSQLRREGFVQVLRTCGRQCRYHALGGDMRLLRRAAKPLGVLACDDVQARQVVSAALASGLKVPQEVAVVGVDNDEALCEVGEVPLSSVDPASRRVGFEAAALLERLMRGKAGRTQCILVPPAGIVVRSSSDVLAVGDEQVARAMRYMRSHACDPMHVHDMLGVLKVSRRTLEKRFRTIFGRTLHDEIRRLQFERARQLLCETDLRIPQIASRSGFRDPKRFTTLFRHEFGAPPTTFRHKRRGNGNGVLLAASLR